MNTEMSQRLLQSAPALIWLAGTDGRCHWFNETWLAFTGRSMEEETGNGWAEGVHPDDLQGVMNDFLEAFAAKRSFVLDYRLKRHDSLYRWIRDHGLPFTDDDGAFAGYIGYCFDISDWKASEQRLNEQKAELESSNRELERMRLAAAQLALHDELTGLCNRRSFAVHFEQVCKRAVSNVAAVSLLILDIDRFKTINDTFGHRAGDECLKALANVLRTSFRPHDLAARFGGDEFVVLLPETNAASAMAAATNICERVRALSVSIKDCPEPLFFTVSVGGFTLKAIEAGSFDHLLEQADAALYRAKTSGRNIAIVGDATAPTTAGQPAS